MLDVGRFMFGVGGLITHPQDPKLILLLKRASHHSDFNQEKWELLYGRKAGLEEIEDALRREAHEELSINDLEIIFPLRMWHFFRGERLESKEIIGITFVCKSKIANPKISSEHSEYRWVDSRTALELVTVPGIRQDIEIFENISNKNSPFYLSPTTGELKKYISRDL